MWEHMYRIRGIHASAATRSWQPKSPSAHATTHVRRIGKQGDNYIVACIDSHYAYLALHSQAKLHISVQSTHY